MKKINIFLVITIGIIVIIGSWLIFFNKTWKPVVNNGMENLEEQNETKQQVVLVIDDGTEKPKTFTDKFVKGMTAFSLLEDETRKFDLTLKTKTYDSGVFIEAIGNAKNGQNGKYWLYYINNEMAHVAADKKELNQKDEVEFKFEKSPF